jgi:hypothetical protein
MAATRSALVEGDVPRNGIEGARKMEQLPQWLTSAVEAAGMTAYAEGLEPKTLKHTPDSEASAVTDLPILPLH